MPQIPASEQDERVGRIGISDGLAVSISFTWAEDAWAVAARPDGYQWIEDRCAPSARPDR